MAHASKAHVQSSNRHMANPAALQRRQNVWRVSQDGAPDTGGLMTFEEAWAVCDAIPGSFTKTNAQALWDVCQTLPLNAFIAEVGVDQGRSASILMAASKPGWIVALVDAWESILIDNKLKVENMLKQFSRTEHGLAWIINAPSALAGQDVKDPLHLVHIDANHYSPHPAEDCEVWLPKLVSGGIAAFHDYQATFPAVTKAVDKYTKGWPVVGNFESLAVRRKP